MSVHPACDNEVLPPSVFGGVDVLVLSRDRALASSVGSAVEGAHRVHHARRTASALGLLTECNAGVLVTDGAERGSFHKLSRRLRERYPDLVIVAVGERDAAEALIESMNSGRIDSVMLKPLSAGRVRLQVQNAVRRHVVSRLGGNESNLQADWDGDRTVPHSVEWLQDASAGIVAPPASRRRLIGSGIAAAVVGAGIVWTFMPGGMDRFLRPERGAAVMSLSVEQPAAADPITSSTLGESASGSTAGADVTIERVQSPPDPAEERAERDRAGMVERLALADARIASNNLTRPADDSAMFHLMALSEAFPGDESILNGSERLADALLELTDAAITDGRFGVAAHWLNAVDRLGVRTEALGERRLALANAEAAAAEAVAGAAAEMTREALEQELARTEAALAAAASEESVRDDAMDTSVPLAADGTLVRIASTTPVAIASEFEAGSGEIRELEILRLIEPEYPRLAWVRDVDGWIDVEFTVTEAGRTRGIEITGAEAPGWFDRAAIAAIEQWRFAPELRDGEPVERRAKVRLQFKRDE